MSIGLFEKWKKNEDPSLIKITTKDDEIKQLKYKTEKHEHENIFKSLKIDNEYYKKIYKSLNEQKFINCHWIGSASTIGSSTLAILNPSACNIDNIVSGSTALLTSIAILITNE